MPILINTDEELYEYRVRRLQGQAELMQKMTKAPIGGGDPLFENYSALLTFSALMGFNNNAFDKDFSRKPMGESVQLQFFQKDQRSMMDLMAIARTKDVSILKSFQKYEVFSAYAAAGFEILAQKLDAHNRDWSEQRTVNECATIISEWILASDSELTVDDVLETYN